MLKRKSFASDNYSGIHPDILQAIADANVGDDPAYAGDEYTTRAEELFKKHFGPDIDVYFVLTGTAANVLGLQVLLKLHQAIVCAETAHINADECGAPEKFLGCKLITVPTKDGKLNPDLISPFLSFLGDQHKVQPKVISITQPTELGTVYSIEEIKQIVRFAHEHHMFVHMDGARLANAAASLKLPLKDFTTNLGVDLITFGGTKNGMMIGEAVIFLNKNNSHDFKYIRKQGMQLYSKMRFIAAQFIELLSNDTWLKNAQHANKMAQMLSREVSQISGISLVYPTQANAVFVKLDPKFIPLLQKEYSFYVWDEVQYVVRWMTAFNTSEEDVRDFVQFIKKTLNA